MAQQKRGSRFVPLVIGTLVVVGAPPLPVASSGSTPGTHVILITVETLRADHLGAYGYRRHTSPNIDSFAKEAVLFRSAFSHAPETNPSFSSIMSVERIKDSG